MRLLPVPGPPVSTLTPCRSAAATARALRLVEVAGRRRCTAAGSATGSAAASSRATPVGDGLLGDGVAGQRRAARPRRAPGRRRAPRATASRARPPGRRPRRAGRCGPSRAASTSACATSARPRRGSSRLHAGQQRAGQPVGVGEPRARAPRAAATGRCGPRPARPARRSARPAPRPAGPARPAAQEQPAPARTRRRRAQKAVTSRSARLTSIFGTRRSAATRHVGRRRRCRRRAARRGGAAQARPQPGLGERGEHRVGRRRRRRAARPPRRPGRADSVPNRSSRPNRSSSVLEVGGGPARHRLGVAERRRRHVVERRPDLAAAARASSRGQRAPQLRRRTGADDRRDDAGPVAHPGQRDRDGGGAEPVGRGDDGVDDRARARRRGTASTNAAKCSLAPRLSAGAPPRYLPVSTPRPSGDQGSSPTPRASAAGTTSRSTPRCSSEYSTWSLTSGARPGQARWCAAVAPELPAAVVGDAGVAHLAGGDRRVERRHRLLPRRHRVPGVQLPQVDVVDLQPPQRRVERGEQAAPAGAALHRRRAGDAVRLGRDEHLLARARRRRAAGRAPARSRRPRSCWRCRRACRRRRGTRRAAPPASSSSVSRPHVMVPSARRETTRPLRPRCRCFTVATVAGRRRWPRALWQQRRGGRRATVRPCSSD